MSSTSAEPKVAAEATHANTVVILDRNRPRSPSAAFVSFARCNSSREYSRWQSKREEAWRANARDFP